VFDEVFCTKKARTARQFTVQVVVVILVANAFLETGLACQPNYMMLFLARQSY